MAGLLALGSSYSPGLPIRMDSGVVRFSYPITAAGPRRICTVFPFKAHYEPPKTVLSLFTCQLPHSILLVAFVKIKIVLNWK